MLAKSRRAAACSEWRRWQCLRGSGETVSRRSGDSAAMKQQAQVTNPSKYCFEENRRWQKGQVCTTHADAARIGIPILEKYPLRNRWMVWLCLCLSRVPLKPLAVCVFAVEFSLSRGSRSSSSPVSVSTLSLCLACVCGTRASIPDRYCADFARGIDVNQWLWRGVTAWRQATKVWRLSCNRCCHVVVTSWVRSHSADLRTGRAFSQECAVADDVPADQLDHVTLNARGCD
jgi:hypothetical protein